MAWERRVGSLASLSASATRLTFRKILCENLRGWHSFQVGGAGTTFKNACEFWLQAKCCRFGTPSGGKGRLIVIPLSISALFPGGYRCVHKSSPFTPSLRLFPNGLCFFIFADQSVTWNPVISLLLSKSPQQLLLKCAFTIDIGVTWLLVSGKCFLASVRSPGEATQKGRRTVLWRNAHILREPYLEQPLKNTTLCSGQTVLIHTGSWPRPVCHLKGKASFILQTCNKQNVGAAKINTECCLTWHIHFKKKTIELLWSCLKHCVHLEVGLVCSLKSGSLPCKF